MKKITAATVFLLAFLLFSTSSFASWNDYNRALDLMNQGRGGEAAVLLVDFAEQQQNAGIYRKLAEAYVMDEQYQNAAETYYKEADLHRARGDMQTYYATRNIGDRWYSEVNVYYQTEGVSGQSGLAKYEPDSGMYVGAYIEADQISRQQGDRFENFNEVTGKNHAVFFVYHHYGEAFPTALAEQVSEQGAALQIALEPGEGLDMVDDDAYLRQFARDAKASGVPVFLRYASEMNGNWVPWSGNPKQYIEKFRLVSRVMAEEAPNVAIVWAPNTTPAATIHDYYPGDAYVDWVGVNLYSVPFFNGDPDQPADTQNPLDLVDEVYDTYSDRKPIMLAETGASHFTSVGNQDMTTFGMTKMRMLYHGLQTKYPRVKAIHWFSVDTLTADNIREERRLNNFSLTVNAQMLQAYREMMQDPYFMTGVVNGPSAPQQTSGQVVSPIDGDIIRNDIRGLGFAKTYDPDIHKVVYRLNGSYFSEATSYPYRFNIPHNRLQNGKNTLEAVVFDSAGREAVRDSFNFSKGNLAGTIAANSLKLFIDDPQVYTSQGSTRLLATPFVSDGVTLVPLRFITETMGARVQWESSTRQITIKQDDTTIVMTIGQSTVRTDNSTSTLLLPPRIVNGTTFVPLRFISESFGADVHYEASDRSVHIRFD